MRLIPDNGFGGLCRPLLAAALCAVAGPLVSAELPLRLQYPTRTNDVVLIGVADGELEVRPRGQDTGGRAYLAISDLERLRARLNFLFPRPFYDAVEQLEAGNPGAALPVIEEYASPFLAFTELSVLPGNMLPTVLTYLEALVAAERWDRAADVATRLPLAVAPPETLEQVGAIAVRLAEAGQERELRRVHEHILGARDLSDARLGVLMELAERWRSAGDYRRAFDLYRKIQVSEGPHRTRARLWVAYSSFYLGHEIVPDVFLDTLPEMEAGANGYSLRELIRARLRMREGDIRTAMRYAAKGKTYANANDPWYPELLHLLAELYAETGRPEAAASARRELTVLFPESRWAKGPGGTSANPENETQTQ